MFRRLHIVVVAVGVVGVFVAALVFITFPINTAWLLVSVMPVAMLGGVLLHMVTPGDADSSVVLRPGDGRMDRQSAVFRDRGGHPDALRSEGGEGVWRGTVSLRDSGPGVRLVPLRVLMSGYPLRSRLLPSEQYGRCDRVVGFEVLDGDDEGGLMRFRLDVIGEDRATRLTHELCVSGDGGRLSSVDGSEDVTLDLGRERSEHHGVVL